MAARAKTRSAISTKDATSWRRFLTSSPPLNDLIEIRRLHDNKTIIRRRADLPATFSSGRAHWRPAS